MSTSRLAILSVRNSQSDANFSSSSYSKITLTGDAEKDKRNQKAYVMHYMSSLARYLLTIFPSSLVFRKSSNVCLETRTDVLREISKRVSSVGSVMPGLLRQTALQLRPTRRPSALQENVPTVAKLVILKPIKSTFKPIFYVLSSIVP